MKAEKRREEAREEGGFRWWGRVRGPPIWNTVMVGMAVWGPGNTRVKLTFVL